MSTLTKPDPLDPTVFHTREQYREWQRKMYAYHAAINEAEAAEREANTNKQPHTLTDFEYDTWKRKLWEDEQARQAERLAAEKAAAKVIEDYLASTPDVAVITENSPYFFVQKVAHWALKGYTLPDDGVKYFVPGCYSIEMVKPAKAKKTS